jgi:hypothetical protein
LRIKDSPARPCCFLGVRADPTIHAIADYARAMETVVQRLASGGNRGGIAAWE